MRKQLSFVLLACSALASLGSGSRLDAVTFSEFVIPTANPGCTDVTIQDSTFMSTDIGVLLDNGTTRTTVRRVKFVGQSRAAIYDPRGNGNDYYENDYSGIDSSAVPVEHDFLSL